ncbi:polysaccharide deacetylase family protein [Paenibacillus sp. HJGM_3]|uniref:polysaccharide deacetylase family protein n=1 Tax=Paenibacillus sp. HJGM_3 TaxID=3379816 RepID=UPI00385F24DA
MNISKLGLAAAAALLLTASSTSAAAAPAKKERFYYEQRGEIVWEVKTDQKLMALTFDDGPDPEQTPAILDLLRKYNAKCTFFVVGRRVQAFPELAKRVVDEGHELGNHTFNHIYFNNASSAEQIRQQLALTEEAIEQATKTRSVLFRPPGGTYNDLLVEVSNKAGLKPVLWSWHQDTRDWKLPGVSRITSKVLHNARSGDIVLFHDHVHPRTQTIQALEIILPELQKRGYEFVTVSELLKHAKTQPVRNPAK